MNMDIQTIVVIVFVSAFIVSGIFFAYKSEQFKKQEFAEKAAKIKNTRK